jgi:glutaredoxin
MFFARPFLALGLMGLLAGTLGGHSDASAQQIFRITGPDGRVTFSDQPPRAPSANAKAAPVVGLPSAGPAGGGAGLPFELRQVASRYPVTLYSSPSCAPCASGRAMLSARGLPFTEKTVTSNDDIEALKRVAGAPSLPFLTIGGQQIKGYSDTEWGQFLDAAGYPKTSQLPANYTQAPATPLVDVQAAQRAAAAPRVSAESAAPSQPAEAPLPNPSGIRF